MSTPRVILHGTNNLDRSLVVSVDGVLYEYFFHGDMEAIQTAFRKIMRVAPGRALNWLKKRSSSCQKVEPR